MNQLLHVSLSPHVRDKTTTSSIMKDVLIALMPATIYGICNFKLSAAIIVIVTVVSCVVTEFLYEYLMKKPITIMDYSAAVTGLILALNLPSTVPLWLPVIGSVFAIVIVKQLYGGIGQNFMNPALAARCFLLISFTGRMTNFVYDGVASATPQAILKAGGHVDIIPMIVGNIGGTIGETSVIALLLGAAYLVFRGVIKLRIPFTYIGTFALFTLFLSPRPFDFYYLACEICGGGLVFGAFFMATDYATSPITSKGQIIFGIILGLLTGLFRFFGTSAEGVSYAIIISNLLVPLIEKLTLPTPFGKEGVKDEK